MVKCAFSGCDNEFTPNTKRNQKYCSVQCSSRANNQKAMKRYYQNKELLGTPKRKCATPGCATILRRTNESRYCDPCRGRKKEVEENNFRGLVLGDD